MYKGKYDGKHRKAKAQPVRRKTYHKGRLTAMVIATAVLLALAIGGTVAWLSTKDAPITNTFNPSKVACEVTENFNGEVKSNVNVKNTGDTEAYIRVKLVTYRTNDRGQHIGGTAELPSFTPGENWVEHDGYYYYTLPVAADGTPATNLADSMTLTNTYEDADGGHQSIDVMAEAIQSVPEDAVKAAWGAEFSIGADGSLNVPNV
jgi:hypothetical protein